MLPHALAQGIESLLEGRELRALRKASDELTQSYHGAQPRLALSTAEHRLAYLLVRLPATYAAISAVLSEVRERVGEIRSVLDLGTGPGTASWAAAELFPELERITLVERDAEMVALGKRLAAPHPVLGRAEWIVNDLRSAKFEVHDLVLAAYSLGELGGNSSQAISVAAWNAATKAFALVEPGTPRGFATVLQVRDSHLEAGHHIAAPCPVDAECPMKNRPGDWCHFAARLERSSLHRRLKAGELGYEDEKFSYVLLARDAAAPQAPARILRHPVHGKGHIKLTLCQAPDVREVKIAKSDRETFREARRAGWGDPWPQKNADQRR